MPANIFRPGEKTPVARAAWYSIGGAWNFRKVVTVDHSKVPNTDQTNFPLLVSFTDPDLRTIANGGSVQNANGYDIAFAGSDGSTKLDHEIEKYVATTGEVVMWVRVPTLSHLNDTIIYMYFGNSSILASQENATGVWDGSYGAVWHLKEAATGAAGAYRDSTSNANHSTNANKQPTVSSSGKIGNAESFSGAQMITPPNSVSLSPGSGNATMSGWVYTPTPNDTQTVYWDYGSNTENSLGWETYNGRFFSGFRDGASHSMNPVSTSTVSANTWYHVTVTRTGTSSSIYVNGAYQATVINAGIGTVNVSDGTQPAIGVYSHDQAALYFNGLIDEIRFSKTDRSADWISAEYNNQSAPGAFSTLGAKESTYSASTYFWGYRKDITVTNNVASALDDYQVKLTLDTATLIADGKMQNTCSDMRFAETDGSDIPYWIESGCNTTGTVVWIKTDLASSASKTVYMYYDNSAAAALSDGNRTFVFFDDFSGSAIDATKWEATGTGTTTVSGGIMTTTGTSSWRYVKSLAAFGPDYALRSRLKTAHSGSASYHERLMLTNGSSGSMEIWYSNSPAYRLYNGASTTGVISGWSADTYAVQDIIRDAATSVIFKVNDANQVALSSNVYAGNDCKISFNTALTGSSMSADWVAMRKYITAEPSHAVGAEEFVGIPVMDHFVVTGSDAQAAGSAQTVTVTAMGNYGEIFTDYSGSKDVVFSGAAAGGSYQPACNDIDFGTVTPLLFTDGVATCALKLYKAETAQINATQGAYGAGGHTLGVAVSPSVLSGFGITAPATAVAGESFRLTLVPRDLYGNVTAVTDATGLGVNQGAVDPGVVASAQFAGYAAPDLDRYAYEKDITVVNNVAQDVAGYQVKLTLDTATLIANGKMQSTCSDMRFSETDNANLPYWLESGCNTASTIVWIRTDLAASATKTIYFYHGNATAGSSSDASGVFETFDDFSGAAVDTSKWNVAGTFLVSGGTVRLSSGSYLSLKTAYGANYAVRSSVKLGTSSWLGFEHAVGSTQAWCKELDIFDAATMFAGNHTTFSSTAHNTTLTAAYNILEVERYAGHTRFSINDVLKRDETNVVSAAYSRYPVINGHNSTVYSDWIAVRKRVAVEPGITVQSSGSNTFGGEYIGNVTISGVMQPGDVTLTITNGGIVQAQTIYIDQIDHFAVSGASTQLPGVPQTLTITAVGTSGNTFASYDGSKDVTFSGANAINTNVPTCSDNAGADVPFGTITSLTFTDGVATCALKLYKAETAVIDVTDGTSSATAHALSVLVSAGALGSFSLDVSGSANAGVILPATLTAGDSYGNLVASYAGEHNITFSGAHAVGAHTPTFTDETATEIGFGTAALMNFIGGVAVTDLKLYKAETATVVASDGTRSAGKSVVVSAAGLDNFVVTAPASAVSDVPFVMSLAAKDSYGNVAVVNDPTALSSSHGTISPASIAGTAFADLLGPDSNPYSYRKNIAIANNVASDIAGYQVRLALDTAALVAAGRMQSDCDDLRFAQTDNSNIPYWIESGCNTSSTIVWIKTDLTASASKNIHMYYGSGSAVSASAAEDVFDIGDDFDDGILDSGWTFDKLTAGNSNTESGGTLSLQYALNSYAHLQRAGLPANFVVETKIKRILSGSDYSWAPGVGVWFNSLDNIQELFGGAGTMKYISNQVINGSVGGSVAGALVYGTDYYFRIVISSGNYYVLGSADNANWTTVSSGSRPASWTINGSSVLALGSGYEATGYANADLDNNYSSTGAVVDAYYDWVRVRKYAATEPTVMVSADSAIAGTYEASFTIADVIQAGTDTITIENGSLIQTQDIYIDQVDHFNVSGSSSQAAGSSQAITVTAIGVSGNTFVGYSGDKPVTFVGAAAVGDYFPTCTDKSGADIRFGSVTTLGFVNGVATCELKLYKAETAVIGAADGDYDSEGHTLSVVISSTAGSFGATLPATFMAGVPAQITLTAGDGYGNPATTYVGEHDITFSGANIFGIYSPTCTDKVGTPVAFGTATALDFVAGVAHCDMTLYKAETADIGATDGTFSVSRGVGIVAGPFFDFDISLPADTTSGVPFRLGLTARDRYGNNTTDVDSDTNLSVNHGNLNGATIPAGQFLSYSGPDAQAYAWRKNITLTNNVAQNVSGYQLRLTLDTAALIAAGTMQADCDDLRFAEMDNADIPYWMEGGCNTTATYVWIKTDLPSLAAKTVYLYHGNGAVVAASSGSGVFAFFDNFETTDIGGLGSWVAEYNAGSFSRGHHAYVVADAITSSRAMETYMSGGGSGTYYTDHAADIAAGDYTVDFGLYTNYGQSYDSNMRSKVSINGVEAYSGVPTAGNVWESRSFDLPGSGAISSVAFGQWGSWSDADPVMRYDDVRVRKLISSVPTVAIGDSASASNYAGNFTISGIVQQTSVTLTVQNGSSIQTADIDVAGVDYMSHFKIEGSAVQVPGIAQTVTVSAMGESGNPYALYTGSRTLRLGGADAMGSNVPTCSGTPFGEDTTLVFDDYGVAHCSLVLYKTGTWDITATDGINTADENKLHVAVSTTPASLHSFDVTVPASITSESAFPITLTARDSYGNALAALDTDTTLAINHGTLSTTTIAPAFFTGGTYVNDNVIVSAAYINYNAAVLTIANGSVTATRNINIIGVDHMDHLTMETTATERTGTGYALTLTAIGRSGNVFPGYDAQRSVIFSGADTIGAFAPVCSDIPFGTYTPLTFTNGVASCTLKLYKAGSYTVTATQDTYSASHGANVLPNVVIGIELNAPAQTTSESAFALGITTYDAYGNVTNYVNSNVNLGVSAGAISPAAIGYTQFRDDGYYSNANFVISHIYTDQDVDITVSNNGASTVERIHVLGLNQMDHFTLSSALASQGAGESQLLTATAIKDSGETNTAYVGVHNLILSGAGSVGGHAPTCAGTAFGQSTSLTFDQGVATCPLILYAGAAANVAISGEGFGSSALPIAVSPLSATAFDIPASFSTTSGVPFSVSFVARDMYGNLTAEVPNDMSIEADQGTLTPTVVPSASFIEGSYSRSFTLSGISLDATAMLTFTSGEFSAQRPVYVTGTDETSHFTLGGTGAQVAGGSNTVTLTAITVSGQTDLDFTGQKSVTFSLSGTPAIGGHDPTCANAVVGSAVNLDFQNGVASADLIVYKAGTFTLNASAEGYSTAGHSLGASFYAGPAAAFDLGGSSSSVSGTPFPVSLTARDQYTNVTNDIPEDIAIATDAGTLSPAAIVRANFSNGSYAGNLTLGDIAATTAVHLTFTSGSYSGTKTVTVSPVDQMDRFTLSVSSSPTAGQAYTLTVSAIGLSGNLFPAYNDAHDLTFSGADAMGDHIPTCAGTALGIPTTLTFTNGRAQCPLVLYKAQTVSLLIGDGNYDNQDNIPTLTVLPAAISDLIVTAPASVTSAVPFSIDFTAKDVYGNTTTVVPNDISVVSDHGTLAPLLVAKENLQTNGTYSQNFNLSGILTSIENNTLTFTSGGISKTAVFSVAGVDHMHHFRLSGSSTQTAGAAQTLTITAIGESGSVFSDYAGIKNILVRGPDSIGAYSPSCSDRNGNDVFFGNSAAINFSAGVATCTMKLYKAGVSDISAASSSYASTGNNLQVTVAASALYSFSGSVPTVAVTDIPFLLTLTAMDLYGNTTRDVASSATLSTDRGTITPAWVPASEFTTSGTYTREATIGGIYADTTVNMIARNGNVAQPAQLIVTGIDRMDHLMVTSASSRLTAGNSIQAAVSILKADGSVYADFSGDKSVNFTGADAIDNHASTFTDKSAEAIGFDSSGILTFVNGIASTTLTLYRAGALNVEATDNVHQNNVPLVLTVDPGALFAFAVTAPESVTVNVPFSFALTARDAYGNVTTDVSREVTLAADRGTLDVVSIPAIEFAGGTVTRNLTLSEISEDAAVTLTVSSNGISASARLSVTASSGGAFIIREKIDVSITRIVLLPARRFGLLNVPVNAAYLAVSDEPTFKGVSWELMEKSDALLNRFYLPFGLYAKFRTKGGSESDVISCTLTITVSDGADVGVNLAEGDIVKTADSFDVYFIKYRGGKQYRRLILSPGVFNSYRHLYWENIRVISRQQMDAYFLSSLAQVRGDAAVFELFPDGDTGERRALDPSRLFDPDSVYEINSVDRDSYEMVK